MDPYQRIRARELYRNHWLVVEAHDIVHPTGVAGEHVLIVTPKASVVVVEDGGELLFTRQPRFGAREWVVEIVKGGRDAGESALECAQRELREELGVTARAWAELGQLYEIPSILSDPVSLFVASGIESDVTEMEENESIEPFRMPVGAALDAALGGEIDDAVTVAALFRYAAARGLLVRRA